MPLRQQLLNILNISSTYSWNDFLQALATAATVYRTRIPLFIDSLHEATSRGSLSSIWERELSGLIRDFESTSCIVIVTTCRKTYKNVIWPNNSVMHVQILKEFSPTILESAVEAYLVWYNIKADLTASSLAQFQHPLYLRIFCESKNRGRQEEKQIYVGEQTLFEVFDDYLKACNQAICKQINRHPNASILLPALERIAQYLWEHRSRVVPLKDFVQLVDGQPLENLDWPNSTTYHLLNEGPLICRDWHDRKDIISFTYDLLGGYLIARALLYNPDNDSAEFVKSAPFTEMLFCSDYRTLHPLHEDIRRCYAALFPLFTKSYLHAILPNNAIALDASVKALFEMRPEAVDKASVHLISQLFKYRPNRKYLLKMAETTVGHVDHPLSISFWSEQLEELSLPERDLSWTEHVREHAEEFEKRIARFEAIWQKQATTSTTAKARLHLEAQYIVWMLTTTVYNLRDTATRALYWYGRRRPVQFFELVTKSLTLNDPYISERMLAATYGVAMARHYDFEDPIFTTEILPIYGRQLYNAFFKPDAPHATTHLLSRNYAGRTVEIALMHHPSLLTREEYQHIRPPYMRGGIREWGKCVDQNEHEYRDGNHPFGMQIGDDDPLRWLGPSISPYHSTPESQQATGHLWWRIYNLGYSFEHFGEVDRRIAIARHAGNYDKIGAHHYGKKYCQIALYELAGYQNDKGLLKEDYNEPHEYTPHIDIDPSFPIPIQEYHLVQSDLLEPVKKRV